MNKILMSSLLAILIFSGCNDSKITSSESSDDIETLESNSYDSYDNEENDDDSEENENYEFHNQGVACLSCHGISSGTIEYDERFTSGGTVYNAIDSVNGYATGYKIRLVLENTLTTVTYEIEEGDGNSFTEYSAGSINGYTAQVIDSTGAVVNSSTANSHDVTRLDCNVCHTAIGTGGAPGRITSYDYYASLASVVTETTPIETNTTTQETNTTSTVSFASAVMPVLENKCQVCHKVGGMNEQLLITDSASTYTEITLSGYTDTTNVDSSSLLTKALGVGHGGGAILNTTDVEYQTLKNWITQGTLNN